jgi:hypothetical protein
VAFLSYDIAQCTSIVEQLHSQELIEPFVTVDPKELESKISHIPFSQPLSISNYIVCPISQGKTLLAKDDKGFQRKMKSLGYPSLPHVIYKKDNHYKIRFPERFIYHLFTHKE